MTSRPPKLYLLKFIKNYDYSILGTFDDVIGYWFKFVVHCAYHFSRYGTCQFVGTHEFNQTLCDYRYQTRCNLFINKEWLNLMVKYLNCASKKYYSLLKLDFKKKRLIKMKNVRIIKLLKNIKKIQNQTR